MFYYGKVSIRWVGSVENGEVLALWEPEQFLFQKVYKYTRYLELSGSITQVLDSELALVREGT